MDLGVVGGWNDVGIDVGIDIGIGAKDRLEARLAIL